MNDIISIIKLCINWVTRDGDEISQVEYEVWYSLLTWIWTLLIICNLIMDNKYIEIFFVLMW